MDSTSPRVVYAVLELLEVLRDVLARILDVEHGRAVDADHVLQNLEKEGY